METERITIPLIKNHHTHASLFAVLKRGLDIGAIHEKRGALETLSQLNDPKTQAFNLVYGWNNSHYTFQDGELDDFAPMLICNVSLHDFIMNRGAKERSAHLDDTVVNHIDHSDWIQNHLHLILKLIVNGAGLSAKGLGTFFDDLAKDGTWFAEDNLLPSEAVLSFYRSARCLDRTRLWADIDTYQALSSSSKKKIAGIKIFLDGALGAGTAALKKGYLNTGGGYHRAKKEKIVHDLMLHSDKSILKQLYFAAEIDCPVSAHAIGDQATEQFLSTLEKLKRTRERIPPLIRLEHCQFLTLSMAERAKRLGIILSMQPNFSDDSRQYIDRLSAQYRKRNNPFRMLIDTGGFIPGKDLLFGTDTPPYSAEYALKSALFPPLESQKLTIDEVVAGFCMPDTTHGHLDVCIEADRQLIQTRIHLRNGSLDHLEPHVFPTGSTQPKEGEKNGKNDSSGSQRSEKRP